jgi:hypothetical protein
MDLSRFCATPLITYCAVKELNRGGITVFCGGNIDLALFWDWVVG